MLARNPPLRGHGYWLGGQLCDLKFKLVCIESSLQYEWDITIRYFLIELCSDMIVAMPFGG